MPTSSIIRSSLSPESAPAGTPIQEVLATANERFAKYGFLKHNPARKQSDYSSNESSMEQKLSLLSNSPSYTQHTSMQSEGSFQLPSVPQKPEQEEEYPALPTLDFAKFHQGIPLTPNYATHIQYMWRNLELYLQFAHVMLNT